VLNTEAASEEKKKNATTAIIAVIHTSSQDKNENKKAGCIDQPQTRLHRLFGTSVQTVAPTPRPPFRPMLKKEQGKEAKHNKTNSDDHGKVGRCRACAIRTVKKKIEVLFL
jgi:hypothetical protein